MEKDQKGNQVLPPLAAPEPDLIRTHDLYLRAKSYMKLLDSGLLVPLAKK